jgi:ABC-type oligopeptide transport system substrate-binding subunit
VFLIFSRIRNFLAKSLLIGGFLQFGALPLAYSTTSFRLHILIEPQTIDPIKSLNPGYILQNLHGKLFKVSKTGELVSDIAKSCKWNNKSELVCKLMPKKWSTGEAITTKDIAASLERAASKESLHRTLFDVCKGESEQLSIRTAADQLTIACNNYDSALIAKLAHPGLAISHKDIDTIKPDNWNSLPVSGAFQLVKIERSKKWILQRNLQWGKSTPKQVSTLEFYLVTDDGAALNMYQQGQLDYLRRIPSSFISQFNKDADFHLTEQWRADHIALNDPQLKSKTDRKLFAQSLDFGQLKAFLQTPGQPGCLEIPYIKKSCQEYKSQKKVNSTKTTQVTFHYNVLGGDDHRKVAEWVQDQIQLHTPFSLKVESLEPKVYQSYQKKSQLAVHRKSINLAYPHCQAMLDSFDPTNSEFSLSQARTELVEKFASDKKMKASDENELCKKIVKYLMDEFWIIPTGKIFWAHKAKVEFKGWFLNPLGELDLSGLEK